jgi:uncharacterized alkaline shock family protein YloU
MTDRNSRYDVVVRINQRKELEEELDRAVQGAVQEALKNPGRGVLVTRHDHQKYTVELSSDVPYGMISELSL